MPTERLSQFRAWQVKASRRTTFVFFEVVTTEERYGLGEATMSSDDEGVVRVAARLFEQALAGSDIRELPAGLDRLSATVSSRPELLSATAASALEHCVWDLRGQLLGLPVSELLGGTRRDIIKLYANINRGIVDRTPDGFALAAKGAADAGFKAIKCAPFDGVRPEQEAGSPNVRMAMARLAAVREAAPHVRLMVDCHGRLGLRTARDIVPALMDLGVSWFEEPLVTHPYMNEVIRVTDQTASSPLIKIGSTEDFRALGGLGIPLAGGEFEFGIRRFESLLRTVPLSTVMPDVKHCGGIWQATLVGALASARGVRFAPHNPSGPVASTVSAHVCAAAKDFEILEYQWGEVPNPESFVLSAEPVVDGEVRCPIRPGLGISLNYEALGTTSLEWS